MTMTDDKFIEQPVSMLKGHGESFEIPQTKAVITLTGLHQATQHFLLKPEACVIQQGSRTSVLQSFIM